jgi:hypothetical protein
MRITNIAAIMVLEKSFDRFDGGGGGGGRG